MEFQLGGIYLEFSFIVAIISYLVLWNVYFCDFSRSVWSSPVARSHRYKQQDHRAFLPQQYPLKGAAVKPYLAYLYFSVLCVRNRTKGLFWEEWWLVFMNSGASILNVVTALWAGEMTQWVKCLLCKHEGLVDLQHPPKSCMLHCWCFTGQSLQLKVTISGNRVKFWSGGSSGKRAC